MYSIAVHIYFPPTIFTPGYEEENKTKPRITLKIEETDDGITPDKAAAGLLRGEFAPSYADVQLDKESKKTRCPVREFPHHYRSPYRSVSHLGTGCHALQQLCFRLFQELHCVGECFVFIISDLSEVVR